MWKRIHSNRDPSDTLYSELRREFKPYFSAAGNGVSGLINRNRKVAYGCMVVLLLISAVLSFTVGRTAGHPQQPAAPKVISRGFDQIMVTAGRLRETILLKRVIDSLSRKQGLSAKDSAALDSALDRLSAIQKTINSKQ